MAVYMSAAGFYYQADVKKSRADATVPYPSPRLLAKMAEFPGRLINASFDPVEPDDAPGFHSSFETVRPVPAPIPGAVTMVKELPKKKSWFRRVFIG